MKVYQSIAMLLSAIENCHRALWRSTNVEWQEKHTARVEALVKEYMPSGSGFDSGTTLDESSTPEKIVFNTSFHHMDDVGMYDGWTEHQVIVTPSLQFNFNLRITGRDKNETKDYMFEIFRQALEEEEDKALIDKAYERATKVEVPNAAV